MLYLSAGQKVLTAIAIPRLEECQVTEQSIRDHDWTLFVTLHFAANWMSLPDRLPTSRTKAGQRINAVRNSGKLRQCSSTFKPGL